MRRKITLTESQFNNLVRKCVNEAIDEAWYNDWNDFKHGARKTALGMAAAGSLSAVSPLSADNAKDNDYVYTQQMSQDELFNDVIKKAIKQSRLMVKLSLMMNWFRILENLITLRCGEANLQIITINRLYVLLLMAMVII